jgi:hypothetical protein
VLSLAELVKSRSNLMVCEEIVKEPSTMGFKMPLVKILHYLHSIDKFLVTEIAGERTLWIFFFRFGVSHLHFLLSKAI